MTVDAKSRQLTRRTWEAMKRRCNVKTATDYKYYGGRGITYSKSWEKFENFLKDMGERSKGLSLERIDNEKGYSKKNCKWATHKEQCNNRRSTAKYIYEGESLSVKIIAKKASVNYRMLLYRLRDAGMSVEDAVRIPSGELLKAKTKQKQRENIKQITKQTKGEL